ncbi:MAG: hypothetical protein JWN08_2207 [Frankiales bacterium]|nr:hypothetical protein [Frankiales bacterium]
MPLTGRDRVLAGLFGLQLTAASVFGLVLVDGLGDGGPDRVAAVAQRSAAATAALPPASATTGAVPGAAGIAGTVGTTTTTGQAGASDVAPAAAAAAGPAVVAPGAPIKIGAVVTQTGAINFAASAQGTRA